ncbi:MAG: hypothetical protein ACJ8KX_12015 [Chthoniobacterales bacterium]
MRRLVSLAIVLHFFAVLTAVMMPPFFRGQPASAAIWVYQRVTRHYLEFVALTNDYRFYAPDIATYAQAWFRFLEHDGTVRWKQFGRRDEYALHLRYQRRLGIALMLESALRPSTRDPRAVELTPAGHVLFASFVRHAARENKREGEQPDEIQLYLVAHRARTLAEIRSYWAPTDPRLYLPRYLGTYDAKGALTLSADPPPTFPLIPMSLFLSTMLHEDLHAIADRQTLPDPIRELLVRHPDLVAHADDEDLREKLRATVAAADPALSDPTTEW